MKQGQIVVTPDKRLGIVYPYSPERLATEGARLFTEDNQSRIITEELAAVTEFTPDLLKRLGAWLPNTAWAVKSKEFGLTGTDPEIFAFDSKGTVIPAWTWLNAKDQNPEFYYDGVQAEFITAATTCHNYQTDNVRNKLAALDSVLKSHNPKAYLATADVVKLDRKTLLTSDDKYIELGCSPSQNAYPEVKPIDIGDPRKHPYRYSGCHLHMSILDYDLPSWFPHGTVVMMDKIVGVMLTALGRDMEDPIRRQAYGRAGEYRVPTPQPANRPSWGAYYNDKVWARLEYRTPGSFLLHHPALFNFAADLARVAFRMGLIMDGRLLNDIGDVQGIINNCDADAANKLIQAPSSYFHKVLNGNGLSSSSYGTNSRTMSILSRGAKASGYFGGNVYDNWHLGGSWHSDNYNNGNTRWGNITQGVY